MTDDETGLGDVLDFDLQEPGDEYRWIVLFEEDYEDVALDVDGNVALKVDIEQTGEVIRLAAQSLAALSPREADGDDVLRDMIDALEREVGDE